MGLEITASDTPVVAAEIPKESPPVGTPEYETWLTATAQAKLDSQAPQAPDGLPSQFWNAETKEYDYKELAKSYTALRAKMDGGKAPEKAPETPAAKAPEKTSETPTDAPKFDRAKYTAEIGTNGALSDASYAELDKAGYDRGMVDAYVAGQQALHAQTQNEVLSTVGGQAAFDAMKTWASSTFTDAELARFNSAVNASKDSAMTALELLKTRYESANGKAPRVHIQGGNAPTSSSGFASQQEAVAATMDPRYKNDPAYRATVERKLAARTY